MEKNENKNEQDISFYCTKQTCRKELTDEIFAYAPAMERTYHIHCSLSISEEDVSGRLNPEAIKFIYITKRDAEKLLKKGKISESSLEDRLPAYMYKPSSKVFRFRR